MIDYRSFDTADIPDVLSLWRSDSGVRLHDNGEDSEAGIRRCLENNAGLSFVAEDGGAIVGAVLNGQDGRRGYVYHLFVAEGYRRQGVATRLLELTEQKLKSVGIRKLALFVLNENETAQEVYRALNWREVTEARAFAKLI